jgi:hypothetical protein
MTAPVRVSPSLPALSAALPRGPEEHVLLRAALLLLLLDEVGAADGIGVERLGYYDFFSANPFAVFGADDDRERAELHAAGFDEGQLAYASTGARFANRRQRLQHDVALLVAYGLVGPSGAGYAITPAGRAAASRLLSLYAGQYRAAARLVHGRFRKLSDTALAERARDLLRHPSLLLDLYGSPSPDADQGLLGDTDGADAPTDVPHDSGEHP